MHIPNFDSLVWAAAGKTVAAWMPHHAVDGGGVIVKCVNTCTRSTIPQPHSLVIATTYNQRAVRTEWTCITMPHEQRENSCHLMDALRTQFVWPCRVWRNFCSCTAKLLFKIIKLQLCSSSTSMDQILTVLSSDAVSRDALSLLNWEQKIKRHTH